MTRFRSHIQEPGDEPKGKVGPVRQRSPSDRVPQVRAPPFRLCWPDCHLRRKFMAKFIKVCFHAFKRAARNMSFFLCSDRSSLVHTLITCTNLCTVLCLNVYDSPRHAGQDISESSAACSESMVSSRPSGSCNRLLLQVPPLHLPPRLS